MSFSFFDFGVVTGPESNLPTGLQSRHDIARRRRGFLVVFCGLNLAALCLLGYLIAPGGWTLADSLIMVSALCVLPPFVLAFLNTALGFVLKRTGQRGIRFAAPHIQASDVTPAIKTKTAILLILRNDPVEEALRRLKLVRASLESTGEGGHFTFFILSDTSDPVLAKREEAIVYAWNRALPDFAPVIYRRRLVNAGFKAGNLADFCRNWGENFDFLVPLDARSFVTGLALVHMVRVMQAAPRIGILQAVALHAPKARLYARFRAFVARLTQEISALGEAAWRADCADYSGRNAIVRVAPFYLHCRMPHLSGPAPFGGAVVMHERIEAAFMRRAGYEVRRMPVELDQFEDHAESFYDDLDTIRFNQYAIWQLPRFIAAPQIAPVYRAMWSMALLESVSPLFLTLAILLLAFKSFDSEYHGAADTILMARSGFVGLLTLISAPLVLGFVDVLATRDRVIAFGGLIRLVMSSMASLVLTFLLLPAFAFRASCSVFSSPFIRHGDQPVVDAIHKTRVPRSAFRSFWPATLFGVDLILLMLIGSPDFALWSLPMTLGYLAIIPLAAILSTVRASRFAIRLGLFGVPEIFTPPREILLLVTRSDDQVLEHAA